MRKGLDLECTPSAKLKITSMRKEVFKLVFSDTIRDAGFVAELLRTDPEFVERFGSFAFDEAAHQGSLDEHTRFHVILAALLGCQGVEAFTEMLPVALRVGVTPAEIREIVYQATAYLGFGIFGGPGKRKAVTSSGGRRRTVSATGILARDWISGSGN